MLNVILLLKTFMISRMVIIRLQIQNASNLCSQVPTFPASFLFKTNTAFSEGDKKVRTEFF